MMGTSSLLTLVTVRRANSSQTLDVYVFTNITKPSPTLIFQLNGLVKGNTKISGDSTVMTAQADQLSTINAGKPVSAMTADLFREFKSLLPTLGKMMQTVFPGIFPDLTRYQAEADQASVDPGAPTLEVQRDTGGDGPGREPAQLVFQFHRYPAQRRWAA